MNDLYDSKVLKQMSSHFKANQTRQYYSDELRSAKFYKFAIVNDTLDDYVCFQFEVVVQNPPSMLSSVLEC